MRFLSLLLLMQLLLRMYLLLSYLLQMNLIVEGPADGGRGELHDGSGRSADATDRR